MNKIFLGQNLNDNIYWNIKAANNRHVLITGKSGAGKTTAVFSLAKELIKKDQSVIFLDHADCIKPSAYDQNILLHEYIRYPFEQHKPDLDATEVILRYSEIIANTWNLGHRQKSLITNALLQMCTSFTMDADNPFYKFLKFNDGVPRGDLSLLAYHLVNHGTSERKNLAFKFLDFILATREETRCYSFLEQENAFKIYKFLPINSGLNAQLVDLFLWYIYLKQRDAVQPRSITIVCDEVGSLSWKKTGILSKLLNEGRKYKINLILITQSLNDRLPKTALNAVMQADLHLAFAPTVTDYTLIAKSLYNKTTRDTISTFSDLPTGICFARGSLCADRTPTFQQTLKIKIPHEEDQ